MIVTTAETHVIGPRKREAPPPGAGAAEDSSRDGAAPSAARRATLSGDTSPGAALSAARLATLSGDMSPEAHMRLAASILNGTVDDRTVDEFSEVTCYLDISPEDADSGAAVSKTHKSL